MDGIDSKDYNLFIQGRPLIETPNRKVELKDSFGVNGGVPFDEKAYSNTSMQLIMFVDGKDMIKDREKVYNLLRNTGVYKEFIPYFDSDKIYYVMSLEPPKFENLRNYGEKQASEVTFSVKPYKYLREVKDITFTTSGTAVNPFLEDTSQPIITIEGTGDVTLKVNGVDYRMQNVDGSLTVNSERYFAYKEHTSGFIENQNSKYMQKPFPTFRPGSNSISVTGDVSRVIVEPRWRTLS